MGESCWAILIYIAELVYGKDLHRFSRAELEQDRRRPWREQEGENEGGNGGPWDGMNVMGYLARPRNTSTGWTLKSYSALRHGMIHRVTSLSRNALT